MKTLVRQFVPLTVILAGLSLFALAAPPVAVAQTGGGTGTQTGNTGGSGQGISDSPLGFDAGVSLERTERATRDTDTFVGAAAPTVGNFGAANGTDGALGGVGGRGQQGGGFFNFFNQLNNANRLNNQSQRNQIRVPLRLGFAKPPRPAGNPALARQVSSTLQDRFASTDRFGGPITVTLDGNTAVLNGSVADAEASRLAERLAMLEPGVLAVQNNLAVAPPVDPELLPTPAVRP